MVDCEMLSAISRLLDEKLEPIHDRLGRLEADVGELKQRTSKLEQEVSGLKQELSEVKQRMSKLEQEVSGLKQELSEVKQRTSKLEQEVSGLKQEVSGLKQEVSGLKQTTSKLTEDMRYVKVVLLENNIIPRLNTIEKCYVEASVRYMERSEQIDGMQSDIDILKGTVKKHSQQLRLLGNGV